MSAAQLQNDILKAYMALQKMIHALQITSDPSMFRHNAQKVKSLLDEYDDKVDALVASGTDASSQVADGLALRRAYKQAQVVVQQRMDLEHRAELMKGGSGGSLRNRANVNSLAASEETTAGLSALIRRMDEQVKQGEAVLSSLSDSSGSLTKAHSDMSSTTGAITSSGKLLSKYARRETTDIILIVMALCLYFGTCLYIINKRLF